MNGWNETALWIDLGSQKATVKKIFKEVLTSYLGGRGFNMKILYDEVPVGADPLGDENIIIFGVGPLNGTPLGHGRMTMTMKSPASGYFLECNSGKSFAPHMKFAGYDAIVVKGKAEEPLYVVITDGKVEFRKASHLSY